MSRILRLVSSVAFDTKTFRPLLGGSPVAYPMVVGTIATPSVNAVPDSLELHLANRSELVLVDGQFTFKFDNRAVSNNNKIQININVYRDAAATQLVYTNQEILASIAYDITETTIPIQFDEVPVLAMTNSIVDYYVTISIGAATAGVVITLEQYSFCASEFGGWEEDHSCSKLID